MTWSRRTEVSDHPHEQIPHLAESSPECAGADEHGADDPDRPGVGKVSRDGDVGAQGTVDQRVDEVVGEGVKDRGREERRCGGSGE